MSLASLVLLPLIGVVAVLVLRRWPTASRWAAVAASLAVIAACGVLIGQYRGGQAVVFVVGEGRLASIVALVGDGLSIPLVSLTAVVAMAAVLASLRAERVAAHLALLLALEAAVMAVFLAGDLIFLYVAWEAVLIPMFFLIGGWGHENRRYAAMKFFLYTFAGSALMLVGIVVLVLQRGGVSAIAAGGDALGSTEQTLVFWLLAAGLLVKVPVWPLHTWLPDAHVEAPTGGSIMLAGVLLKMGAYGLIRLCMGLTPDAFARYAAVLAALGVVGIVYGAAMALAQSDLKRLIAYSSVSHMGFVVLAISTGTAFGLIASVLGMVSHGLVSGALFFLAGALYDRAHTREMSAFGALGAHMPRWSTAFVVAALAGLGLPGLSGFPGEVGAFVESFARFGWPVLIGGAGVLLAGAYSLRSVRLVVHGEAAAPAVWSDLSRREVAAVAPLLALIVLLGVWPRIVADVAAPTLRAICAALGVPS